MGNIEGLHGWDAAAKGDRKNRPKTEETLPSPAGKRNRQRFGSVFDRRKGTLFRKEHPSCFLRRNV